MKDAELEQYPEGKYDGEFVIRVRREVA
ncbi:DUF3275 family protein [Pseudomonas aeruginosa]